MHTQELEHHPTRRRRRKGQRGARSKRARKRLIAIFIALRISDALMLLGAPQLTTQLLTSIITGGIWTTALLVAIFYRHNWARCILIALALLGVVAFLLVTPMILRDDIKNPVLIAVMCVVTLINGGVAWCLISSLSIRYLTHSDHE